MKLDTKEIIKRGYITKEEYSYIFSLNKLSKLSIGDPGEMNEYIWVYLLEEELFAKSGERYFIYFNDPVAFWGGPRPTAGMVGVYNALENKASFKKNLKFFQSKGRGPIDYFNSIRTDKPPEELSKN